VKYFATFAPLFFSSEVSLPPFDARHLPSPPGDIDLAHSFPFIRSFVFSPSKKCLRVKIFSFLGFQYAQHSAKWSLFFVLFLFSSLRYASPQSEINETPPPLRKESAKPTSPLPPNIHFPQTSKWGLLDELGEYPSGRRDRRPPFPHIVLLTLSSALPQRGALPSPPPHRVNYLPNLRSHSSCFRGLWDWQISLLSFVVVPSQRFFPLESGSPPSCMNRKRRAPFPPKRASRSMSFS